MMKQSIILLLLFLRVFGAISTILPRYSDNRLTETEKMLIHILHECNLGLNYTIFYTGNNPDLTQALLTTRPSVDLESWILLSARARVKLHTLTAKSGIVVVLNSPIDYKAIRIYLNYWKCTEDCKVIVLSKIQNSCLDSVNILTWLGYSYYDISYYICFHEKYGPIVFTQDKYYSIRRAHWHQFLEGVESWDDEQFYMRQYKKDLCRNFDFERKKPKHKKVYLGIATRVKNRARMREDMIYDGRIKKLNNIFVETSMLILEKLFKIKFAAYVKTFLYLDGKNTQRENEYFMSSTPVDVVEIPHSLILDVKIAYSHPLYYDTFVILSHKRAEATPLQKIAKFYGIWTLISLIILLIITFVVIYLKTNRNATLAAFDVLRLLINSGVEIPINTLSLKIFFCMVFLYFTVIHSTFSGNLPKFLTIPEFHDSIDSLEDLSDPRIKTIYDRGFYTELNECQDDKIKRKIEYLRSATLLFNYFVMDKNSVCIIEKKAAVHLISELGKSMDEIYMSKNDFGDVISALVVRPRFYLREKIQWATAYMFDVSLSHMVKINKQKAQRIITKQHIISQIEFRKISIDNLMFAFIFLIIGNTVGLVCFLIELVVGKKYYRKINFGFFKKCMTFKRKKNRMKIRRIVVKPKPDIAEID